MRYWGVALIVIGIPTILAALLFMLSTVPTEQMLTLPSLGETIGSGRLTDTYNMPRAQLREMVLQLGEFTVLAGILLFIGGRIEDLLRSTPARPSTDVPSDLSDKPSELREFKDDAPLIRWDGQRGAMFVFLFLVAVLVVAVFINQAQSK